MANVGGGIGALLTINGHVYTQTKITDYTPDVQLLDGEATARSKAAGWEMIREPQGYIVNFSITADFYTSKNPDWDHMYKTFLSLGNKDFVPVRFVDPLKNVIQQDMYFTLSGIKYTRIDKHSGEIRLDPVTAKFIAKKGVVIA